MATPSEGGSGKKETKAGRWRSVLWQALSMGIALALALGVLGLLLWSPFQRSKPEESNAERRHTDESVRLEPPQRIIVEPGCALEQKLVVATAARQRLSIPLLKVTGSVVARLEAGEGNPETRWDFHGAELAAACADWIKARADVAFAEKQLTTIRELNKDQVESQTKLVERLRKLVSLGTDPAKDLAAAEAELRKQKLQGQKDEHEAQTAVQTAIRNRTTSEHQLYLAGIDPDLLTRGGEDLAIIVAEVPEARIALVTKGQACEAQFFAFPDTLFPGRVASLAPTLARERRTLQVFFELDDPQGRLKPGMFAEVGLGTDDREVLLIPADAVLHVGQADYVLVGETSGVWRITEVRVAEAHNDRVEIVSGLEPNVQIIAHGAILLKPLLVEALRNVNHNSSGGRVAVKNPS